MLSLPAEELRDIGEPFVVWCIGMELALKKIFGCRRDLALVRAVLPLSSWLRNELIFLLERTYNLFG